MAYDLIIAGGGLAGAALGRALALAGRRVLVVERDVRFRDRVRGEYLHAWGVAEARDLGLLDTLSAAGAREVPWLAFYVGGALAGRNDVRRANPRGLGPLCLSHPAMQEGMLEAARGAGVEILRPASVVGIEPGGKPTVVVRAPDGSARSYAARLVVGADGREARSRAWGDFRVERDPENLALAGLLFEGYSGLDDASSVFWNFAEGEQVLLFPQGARRVRAYVAFPARGDVGRLSGRGRIPNFLAACGAARVPSDWLADATPAGPLAAFSGADVRVTHPYRDGLALVGDAAACTDPTWGSGLSLTLRDVRVLSERLLEDDDWDAAANAYAAERDHYYERLHTLEGWLAQAFFEVGLEADARRARIFARAAHERDRIPDLVALGPECPCDEPARRRFFGEE